MDIFSIIISPSYKEKVKYTELSEKILCIKCQAIIKHEVLVDIDHRFHHYDGDFDLYYDKKILVCLNCDSITYMEKAVNSEDVEPSYYDPATGDVVYEENASVKLYPVRDQETAYSKSFESILPMEIYATYEEVIIALNNKIPLLTALGLRTLLEQIVKHFGHSDDLGQILNTFEKEGYISTKQRGLLDEIRYLGNDAAHRADSKSRKDLILHLKVLENLIQQLFVYYKLEKATEQKVIQGVSLRPSPRNPIPVVRETTNKRKPRKRL